MPMSWMCKKQTSVWQSSMEAEINSVDAGSRMKGIPALDLWDLVITVLHPKPDQKHSNQPARRNPLHSKASEERTNSQNTTRVSPENFESNCLTESSIPHSLLLLDPVCVHSLSALSLTHESREC